MKTSVTVDNLRDLINLSAKLREESYIDGVYGLSIHDAVMRVCTEEDVDLNLVGLVECTLECAWNDILDWAK